MEPVGKLDRPNASGRRGYVVPTAGSDPHSRFGGKRPALASGTRFRGIAFAAFFGFLISATFSAHRTGGAESNVVLASREIESGTTSSPPAWIWLSEEPADFQQVLRTFYAKRRFTPGWMGEKGALPRAIRLTAMLAGAERQGLDPDAFQLDRIRFLLGHVQGDDPAALNPRDVAELDALLSAEFLRYAWHVRYGASSRGWQVVGWSERCRRTGLLQALENAVGRRGPEAEIRRWRGRPILDPRTAFSSPVSSTGAART